MASGAQALHNSSSTSEIHQSHTERQHSAPSNFGETSNWSAGGTTSCADPPSASLQTLRAKPIWLDCGCPDDRYLLLEDTETGDVLIPLIYLKKFFHSNYGRKVTGLHNRLVKWPAGIDAGPHEPGDQLYWVDCFESPSTVKALIRRDCPDMLKNSGHGRVRLALLPMVFNAMSMRKELTATPFYKALEQAMRASSYWPLLQAGEQGSQQGSQAALLPVTPASGEPNGDEVDSRNKEGVLFSGPRRLPLTAAKYMSPYKEQPGKRRRSEAEAQPEATARTREQHEGGTETAVARLQDELALQKRQCLVQASRMAALEQELVEVKACLIRLHRGLEEVRRGSEKSAAKGAESRDAACGFRDAFAQACGAAGLTSGQPQWNPHQGLTPEALQNMRGLAEQRQSTPDPISRTPPANAVLRRQVSTGSLLPSHSRPQAGWGDALAPSALTSHLPNLMMPLPTGMTVIPRPGPLGNAVSDPSKAAYRLPAEPSSMTSMFDHPQISGYRPPSPKRA